MECMCLQRFCRKRIDFRGYSGRGKVYRFEIRAKVNDVDYPRKVYWIRRDNGLILKENHILFQELYADNLFPEIQKMRKQ